MLSNVRQIPAITLMLKSPELEGIFLEKAKRWVVRCIRMVP
jgi:hypothetical protein